MSTTYDLVVIGSGPGGYVAAIRAGQHGMKVACVEKDAFLGGTCLNVGCIPSKTLLNASEHYHKIKTHGADMGIVAKDLKADFSAMMERKGKVVSGFRQGIKGLFRKNKVDAKTGLGVLKSPTEVAVVNPKTGEELEVLTTKNILLATGSKSIDLPFLPVDEKQVVTSTGALALEKVPKKMLVIGGGVIGVEMASVYTRLGTEVVVIEMMDMICPGMDMDVRKELHKILKKQGMDFRLSTKVLDAKVGKKNVSLKIQGQDGKEESLDADVVLVSVGRKAYSEGLGLENVGIESNPRGQVSIDAQFRTSVPNVFAIGDLVEGPMLAHKASEEGVAVVDGLAGKHGHVDYMSIPGVVYTAPEAANVGLTEDEAKERGLDIVKGSFPFRACSRAMCVGEPDGFVKVIAHKPSGKLLGMHIVGANAGELIAVGVLAIESRSTVDQLAGFAAAHPTLAEAVKEAALAATGGAIHI